MRKILLSGLLVVALSVLAGFAQGQQEPEPQPEPEVPVFQIPSGENGGTDGTQPIVIPAAQELIPIIVELSPSANFTPEGRMSPAAVSNQRQAILSTQERVLDTFEQAGIVASNVHLYGTIPYMALHVDAAGLAALQNHPDVLSIQADEINELFVNFSTPVIGAPTVWNQGYLGTGYAVAIIDTGVDTSHSVFAGGQVIWESCINTTTNTGRFKSVCPGGVDEVNGPGAAAPDDCIGCDHGTHVAGIAAGDNSSIVGLTATSLFRGAAPGATIIAINAFSVDTITDRPGAFDSDVLQALEYVYTLATDGTGPGEDPLKIASINMSLGAGTFTNVCDADNGDYVDIVNQLASVGVATVAASGNQGSKNALSKPACISNIISVGATSVEASAPDVLAGDDGTVAFFSNGNLDLDLLAPGFYVSSSVPGGGFEQKRGTSQAAPFVAGAWAIMRQLYPDASPAEILAQFKLTGKMVTDNGQTTTIGSSAGNGLTFPLLQLDKAIKPVAPVLLTPIDQTVSATPTFSWRDMPLTDRYDVRVYETATDVLIASANNVRSACTQDICSFPSSVSLRDNTNYFWTVQGKTPQGLTGTVARGDFIIRGIKPQGDTISGTPEFIFEQDTAPGVTWYQLEISSPASGDTPAEVIHLEWYEAKEVCEATICTIDTGLNFGFYLGDRDLQWRYRTYNENTVVVSETWKGPYLFTVVAPSFFRSTGIVTDDSGLPTFLLRELVTAEFRADWYRFYVVDPEDFSPVQDYWLPVSAGNCNNGICEFTPEADPYNRILYNGDYEVYANAFTTDQGYSAWSEGDEFSVNAPAPNINWVKLENLYNSRLVGLTETAADKTSPCDLTGTASPTCSVSRPFLEFSFDNGGFSGEWFEIILYRPSDRAVLYQEWVNVYNPDGWDNLTCIEATTSTGPSCTVGSKAYLASGSYQWYLRSWGPGGSSTGGLSGYTSPGAAGDPNDIADFRVDLPDSIIQGMTVTFYADLPAGTTVTRFDGELTFEWDVAEGADYYELVVERANADDDEDPVHSEWYQVGEDIACDEISCSIVTDTSFPNGNYVWQVVYWNGELSDPVQRTFNLNLARPELPFIADMVVYNNENISSNTRVIYQWERLPNTMWYNVQILDASGNEMFAEWYRAREICDAEFCGVWPDLNLVAGRYEWYVKPWGPGGFAGSNDPSGQGRIGPATFRLSGTDVGLPVALTPVEVTVQNSKPVFYWRPATNGAWYQIEIVDEVKEVLLFDGWVYAPESLCGKDKNGVTVCAARPNIDIANGSDYAWRIRSYGPSGFGQWTPYYDFAVDSPVSRVPALIAPNPGALFKGGAKPVFIWSDVGALWYRLEVSQQNGGVIYAEWLQETSDVLSCDGTTCMQQLPSGFNLNGLYEWNVTTWSPGNGSKLQQTETIKFASY